MRNKLYASLVLLAALCMVAWTGYAQGQRTSRQMWEYRVDAAVGRAIPQSTLDEKAFTYNANSNERLINQRAAEGWELVAVGNGYFYFKRPR